MNKIWTLLNDKKERLIYPQMGGMGLELTEYKLFEVYEDPEKQLEISLKIEENFPTDFTYPIDFGTVFLDTWKIPLLKPDYDFPSTAENPIITLEDLHILKAINPYEDGLMPQYIESIAKIADTINKPEMVATVGPFTLAAELAGLHNLAKSTIKNSEFVEALLDIAMENIENFVRASIKAGAKCIQVSEPTAVILSPKMFKKYVTPRLKKILNIINENSISAIHICGDTSIYIPEILDTKPQIISVDQIMSMKELIKKVPSDIVLAGNIDPIDIMLNASPKEVYNTTKKLLNDMEPYANFMISFGCDCPNKTPIENINAVVEAIHG